MSIPSYTPCNFNPSRGGHAPGYLCEAFYRWLEDPLADDLFDVDGELYDIHRLTGALWNCTDVMPSFVSAFFEGPEPVTVAQGVRRVRALGRAALG